MTASENYTVTLSVGVTALPILIGAIQQSKGIALVGVVMSTDAPAPAPASAHVYAPVSETHRYVGGLRNKGITGVALLLELLADGKPRTVQQLTRGFKLRGFAESSAQSSASKAMSAKKVHRLPNGSYALGATPDGKLDL